VQLQDLATRLASGQVEAQLAVEAAGPTEGGVDVLDAVRRAFEIITFILEKQFSLQPYVTLYVISKTELQCWSVLV
jgi:hypothetical protein